MRIVKILIKKFGITHTDTLLEPVRDGLLSSDWRKRNGALSLLGEMLDVIKRTEREKDIKFELQDYD